MKTTTRYIVYYRVSTQKQGRSGLGLEAQRSMVAVLLVSRPGEVLAEYTEIETGKSHKKRPELQKAIDHARAAQAVLIIAKLDRLARNVAFTSALMESELPFICCDMPQADKFTIHIMAAMAEREGKMISERTVAALEALKARGAQLGSARPGHWDGIVKEGPHAGISRIVRRDAGLAKAQDRSREIVQEEMSRRYEPLVPWIREMREAGLTLQQIADNLNAKGCLTRYGRPWQLPTLRRVIQKYLGPEYLGQLNSKLRPVRVLSAANGG